MTEFIGQPVKKFLLIAGIGAAAFCGAPALAADMPMKAPAYKAGASPDPWTGCYVGANIGGGWGRDRFFDDNFGTHLFVGEPHTSGVVGGGQIGCDYQSGIWVVGVEGLFDWADIHGTGIDPAFLATTQHDKIEWFGTTTARLGYAVERSLFYMKAGVGWAHNNSFNSNTAFPCSPCNTNTRTAAGWTVGGGWEYIFATNWSAKIEYSYINLGDKKGFYAGIAPGIASHPEDWKQRASIVLIGLNYRR